MVIINLLCCFFLFFNHGCKDTKNFNTNGKKCEIFFENLKNSGSMAAGIVIFCIFATYNF